MMNSGLAYLKAVKNAFTDEKEKYDKFLKLIKNFTTERFNIVRGIEDVKELLKGHRDLILGFNFFLPMGYEIKHPLEDEQPLQKKPDAIVEANKLLRKIETRFQDHDHVYQSFLAILKMQRDGNKTITTAYKEITELLQGHSDLLDELSRLWHASITVPIHFVHAQNFPFRERSSAVPTEQQMCAPKRKRNKASHDDHHHSVDDRLKRDWNGVVKEYQYYYQDASEEFAFSAKVKDKLQNSNSKDKITEQKLQSPRAICSPKVQSLAGKKYSENPVGELDLSSCEQCTPSYHLLPEEFRSSSSQRTEHDAEVLNDHWKCVNLSINDYSSKHMSKNPYEMILFECEDDRFELDMLLATAKSATNRIEELIEKIHDNKIERDKPINIEKHFTVQNLRCIEQIYDDTGLEVLHMVEMNAPRVLQVILTRLKHKQEEWARCRVDFNKLWADVYAQNYHRSRNHPSLS